MADKKTADKPALDRILKWVAAITALLSLFFGVQKVMQLVTDNTTRSRQLNELKQVASIQQQTGDYPLAWASLESAMRLAESGGTFAKLFGRLDTETEQLRIVREDLATEWLANIRITANQKFSDIVEKLMPVLVQGTVNAAAQRKADLLAYIGWSYFLRNRDGGVEFDSTLQYKEAVALDPNNPYAHAYWGHWVLWHGGELQNANEHFTQALKSGRAKERVRSLQLAALRNRGSQGDVAFVATVADMLNHNEVVPDEAKRNVLWNYSRACAVSGVEFLAALKSSIPPADLVATYETLAKQGTDQEQKQRAACLATLK